jgi:probable H4MPT-linked C1 transfer pathway protein
MASWVGLDIGGANLKGAHSHGEARTIPFALWKEPEGLPSRLRELLGMLDPAENLAVTMTGELCDCFASKREGVEVILQAVRKVAGNRLVKVWTTCGQFVDIDQAWKNPLEVAAANWLALANYVAKLTEGEGGLLIDIGSTTTDIIPLWHGQARPGGLNDFERLKTGELVYTGVRRTSVCALLGFSVAAEWFATTQDVFLMLGFLAEEANDVSTADGRPATRQAAHGRLAHMLCADAETCREEETRTLAEQAMRVQVEYLAGAVERVARSLPVSPTTMILSGSGEFLARRVLQKVLLLSRPRIISLGERWGPALSGAACAYAVARLAEEEGFSGR